MPAFQKTTRYPTSVTLVADPVGDTKMFFCYNCQAPFTQYNGQVVSIMPGVPAVEPYTLTRCRNPKCSVVYSLQGIVEMSRNYIIQF